MYIVLGIPGHIVVDHQVDIVDVDAAAHHIGGHQHAQFAVAEGEHDLLAFALFQIAVHTPCIEPLLLQVAVQVLHLDLSSCKNDDAGGAVRVQDVLQTRGLLHVEDHVCLLIDTFRGFAQRNGDLHRFVQNALRQVADRGWHGGAEHERLAFLGQEGDDPVDVVDEAHVHHPVGLVEHKEFDPFHGDIAQVQVAQEFARCGDHHFHTAGECLLLLVEGGTITTAVKRDGSDGREVGDGLQLLIDLQGKFPRRHHDQGPNGTIDLGTIAGDHVDEREEEGSGFPCTCLCTGDEVAVIEHRRYGLLLDGRRYLDVHVIKAVQQVLTETERMEVHGMRWERRSALERGRR